MAVLLLLICFYILTDAQIVVQSAELPRAIRELSPENDFDIDALHAINPDIIGWIRVEDTGIDYPVLQGANNDYYLMRDYRRQWATAGSIFIDYRNASDYSDLLTVIYGHRMGYGKMFSDITKYRDRVYYDAHGIGKLFMRDGYYDLSAVAFSLIPANEQIIYDVEHSRSDEDAVRLVIEKAVQKSGDYVKTGRYLLLSTCDAKDRNKRDVLLMALSEWHQETDDAIHNTVEQ